MFRPKLFLNFQVQTCHDLSHLLAILLKLFQRTFVADHRNTVIETRVDPHHQQAQRFRRFDVHRSLNNCRSSSRVGPQNWFSRPNVSTVVNVVGLHVRQHIISKNVRHPFESRLIYRDSPEPTLPPAEHASRVYSALIFASRKAQNQAFEFALSQAQPARHTKQFATWK